MTSVALSGKGIGEDMRDKTKLFDKLIKYSCVMPIHKYNEFTGMAIRSVVKAIGDRKDIEFIILDDSDSDKISKGDIKLIKLPKIDLINKLIMGTQLARGKYYCNADYDDLAHPKKFELFDKLLKKNDMAGANNCVFFDTKTRKTYKLKNSLCVKKHKYNGRIIEYPWLQHSNSAIPLDWLRQVGYGCEKKIQIAHIDGHIMTDTPIWVRASMDGLKVGFIEDWKQCWQIIHGDNVNTYTEDQWKSGFDEIEVKIPKELI